MFELSLANLTPFGTQKTFIDPLFFWGF